MALRGLPSSDALRRDEVAPPTPRRGCVAVTRSRRRQAGRADDREPARQTPGPPAGRTGRRAVPRDLDERCRGRADVPSASLNGHRRRSRPAMTSNGGLPRRPASATTTPRDRRPRRPTGRTRAAAIDAVAARAGGRRGVAVGAGVEVGSGSAWPSATVARRGRRGVGVGAASASARESVSASAWAASASRRARRLASRGADSPAARCRCCLAGRAAPSPSTTSPCAIDAAPARAGADDDPDGPGAIVDHHAEPVGERRRRLGDDPAERRRGAPSSGSPAPPVDAPERRRAGRPRPASPDRRRRDLG